MSDLTNVQIGSVVLNMISNIPVGISGIMTQLVNNEIYFAEQLTGDSIGTTVADKYQPAIISLTAAGVMRQMESQGLSVTKTISIGDISLSKGVVEDSSKSLREDGIQKLENLGFHAGFYRAMGGSN